MKKLLNSERSGDFPLVNGNAADIYLDPDDYVGIKYAANALKEDIEEVSGKTPVVTESLENVSSYVVIVGSIGQNAVIDELIANSRLDVSQIKEKWESYTIAVIDNPVQGVSQGLVIAGSDKRGTIYGIFKISEMIGVSPWKYWADSNPNHQDTLGIPNQIIVQGEPTVKYRGIFLNDEYPALTTFVQKFGPVLNAQASPGYNHNFYTKVFELILRLKGNYLWPAMWNNAFWTDDPLNPIRADEYGVVMGTTHQEFMLSSDKEWVWSNRGPWDYLTNSENIFEFWTENVTERKNFESIYALGMRGLGDSEILPDGTDEENIELLNNVLLDQRELLKNIVNEDLTKVPQVVTLYKEVERFYYKGWNEIMPEDVTLIFSDDNHGNLRSLPTDENRDRSGGFGMYYHFDYQGGPRSYRWINTSPTEKIRDQMTMAYEYGIDRIWIVNVGDLKFNELPMEYWFNLAYDIEAWGDVDAPERFHKDFAAREYGGEYSEEIAEVLHTYPQINNLRKPEIASFDTFHVAKFDEAATLLNRYEAAANMAEELFEKMPLHKKDSYYQLVLYPARASMNVFRLMINLGLNRDAASQGRVIANEYADIVIAALEFDNAEMAFLQYELAGGKWYGFGTEYHIGQTAWNPNESQISVTEGFFAVHRVDVTEGSEMLVVPQGAYGQNAGVRDDRENKEIKLNFTSYNRETRFVNIANTKGDAFQFTALTSEPWIVLSQQGGTVDKQVRLEISINWARLPLNNNASGTVTIQGANATVTVSIIANQFDTNLLDKKTFIETDGYISILSNKFTSSVPSSDGAEWTILPGYGRERSAVKVMPPVLDGARTPGVNAPYLEYKVYVATTRNIDVITQFAPSNGPDPKALTRLRYGVSFGDNDEIQIIQTMPHDYEVANVGDVPWADGVENAVRTVTPRDGNICISKHSVTNPGVYSLKIYMVDDGLVLQKILVGTERLDRFDTTVRNTNVAVDPYTRLELEAPRPYIIPSNSVPRILSGSNQTIGGSFDTYFGPPESYCVGEPSAYRSTYFFFRDQVTLNSPIYYTLYNNVTKEPMDYKTVPNLSSDLFADVAYANGLIYLFYVDPLWSSLNYKTFDGTTWSRHYTVINSPMSTHFPRVSANDEQNLMYIFYVKRDGTPTRIAFDGQSIISEHTFGSEVPALKEIPSVAIWGETLSYLSTRHNEAGVPFYILREYSSADGFELGRYLDYLPKGHTFSQRVISRGIPFVLNNDILDQIWFFYKTTNDSIVGLYRDAFDQEYREGPTFDLSVDECPVFSYISANEIVAFYTKQDMLTCTVLNANGERLHSSAINFPLTPERTRTHRVVRAWPVDFQ